MFKIWTGWNLTRCISAPQDTGQKEPPFQNCWLLLMILLLLISPLIHLTLSLRNVLSNWSWRSIKASNLYGWHRGYSQVKNVKRARTGPKTRWHCCSTRSDAPTALVPFAKLGLGWAELNWAENYIPFIQNDCMDEQNATACWPSTILPTTRWKDKTGVRNTVQ